MATPRPGPMDETERTKIVKLYRDHYLTLDLLCERLHRGERALARVLDEAGIRRNRNRTRIYQEAP